MTGLNPTYHPELFHPRLYSPRDQFFETPTQGRAQLQPPIFLLGLNVWSSGAPPWTEAQGQGHPGPRSETKGKSRSGMGWQREQPPAGSRTFGEGGCGMESPWRLWRPSGLQSTVLQLHVGPGSSLGGTHSIWGWPSPRRSTALVPVSASHFLIWELPSLWRKAPQFHHYIFRIIKTQAGLKFISLFSMEKDLKRKTVRDVWFKGSFLKNPL